MDVWIQFWLDFTCTHHEYKYCIHSLNSNDTFEPLYFTVRIKHPGKDIIQYLDKYPYTSYRKQYANCNHKNREVITAGLLMKM